jgi:hypothetical protein
MRQGGTLRRWAHFAAATACLLISIGCSATGKKQQGNDTSEQGAGGQGGVDGRGGTGGMGFGGTGEGGEGCLPCSSDLHSVIDCDGNVVMECPPDQGCSNGECVPACQAANDNKSSLGCDFYIVHPDVGLGFYWEGSCFAAFVTNSWGVPITLSLERNGQSLDISQVARIPSGAGQDIVYSPLPNGELAPGDVAVVFLSGLETLPPFDFPTLSPCPPDIVPAIVGDPALHGTGKGNAFRLRTSAPAIAYDIYPYGGGNSAITSATLLLPTSAWDTNYIAVDAYQQTPGAGWMAPWVTIVAAEDATNVTLNPSAAIVGGGGLQAAPAGMPVTYSLNEGQYLQFVQTEELNGSIVVADRPVGLWGGSTCMYVPIHTQACDGAHQQIPPVQALGTEYVAVRHRNRYGENETPPWRLIGAVDGTILHWLPSPPPGAPTTLDLGETVEFESPGSWVVWSQDDDHPFYAAQYMTGCEKYYDGIVDCRGDAEFVNMVATDQFLSSYTFFTDPTYPESHLVVVRRKQADGTFADVQLDCLGVLTGWQQLGPNYQYTRVDLVTGNFEPVAGCDNGEHVMKSEAPFGVTVWGWGSAATGEEFVTTAVSYAYPAGMSVAQINDVEVPVDPPR